jgi:hypothetical protein
LTKDEAVEHERLAAAQAQRENQAAEKRLTDTHMFGGMPSIPAHHACVYLGGTAGVSMIIILFAMITFMAALFAQAACAALQEKDLANHRPPMLSLTTTLGRYHCSGLFQMPIGA